MLWVYYVSRKNVGRGAVRLRVTSWRAFSVADRGQCDAVLVQRTLFFQQFLWLPHWKLLHWTEVVPVTCLLLFLCFQQLSSLFAGLSPVTLAVSTITRGTLCSWCLSFRKALLWYIFCYILSFSLWKHSHSRPCKEILSVMWCSWWDPVYSIQYHVLGICSQQESSYPEST